MNRDIWLSKPTLRVVCEAHKHLLCGGCNGSGVQYLRLRYVLLRVRGDHSVAQGHYYAEIEGDFDIMNI